MLAPTAFTWRRAAYRRPRRARSLGPGDLVGCSVHDARRGRRAAPRRRRLPVRWHAVPSRAPPGEPAASTAAIEELREAVDLPLVGIGGITAAQCPRSAHRAGARGVAVISAIMAAPGPRRRRRAGCATRFAPSSPAPPAGPAVALTPRSWIRYTRMHFAHREWQAPRDRRGDVLPARFLQAHNVNPRLWPSSTTARSCRRDRYAEVALQEGDKLEIVHMVGGGCSMNGPPQERGFGGTASYPRHRARLRPAHRMGSGGTTPAPQPGNNGSAHTGSHRHPPSFAGKGGWGGSVYPPPTLPSSAAASSAAPSPTTSPARARAS